jgi:hypothetical protein
MQAKRDGIRSRADGRPIEANRQNGFNKIGLEEAAVALLAGLGLSDWPTLVQQRSKSELRGVDIESQARAHGEAVSDAIQQARMHGYSGLARRILLNGTISRSNARRPEPLTVIPTGNPIPKLSARLVV